MKWIFSLFCMIQSLSLFSCAGDQVAGTSVDTEEVSALNGRQGFVILGTTQYAGPSLSKPSELVNSGAAHVGGTSLTDSVSYLSLDGVPLSSSQLYLYSDYIETRVRNQYDSDWVGRSVTRSQIHRTSLGQYIDIQGNGFWKSQKDSIEISLDSLHVISNADSTQNEFWFRSPNQNWTAYLSGVQYKNKSAYSIVQGKVMRDSVQIGLLFIDSNNHFVVKVSK